MRVRDRERKREREGEETKIEISLKIEGMQSAVSFFSWLHFITIVYINTPFLSAKPKRFYRSFFA